MPAASDGGIPVRPSVPPPPADPKTAAIDAENRADFERESAKIKMLLLGAGESGKSTVLKQMRVLYGSGFGEVERLTYKPIIHSNMITAMQQLIAACTELGIVVRDTEAAESVDAIPSNSALSPANVGFFSRLWRDEGIQAAFVQRSKFQLIDSVDYFYSKLDELAATNYVPTIEDVIKTRVRTTGIIAEEFKIGDSDFIIYDVGGQRNERRKWIHCFDDVIAIIFVAAISEYDQTLFEENTQNRLVEALELFGKVCEYSYFDKASIILFLNKHDLFAEKIKTVDLRQPNPDPMAADKVPFLFPDYAGGCDHDAALKYILNKFLQQNKLPRREIFYQVTCATDKDSISTVLDATKQTILTQNLTQAGFME